jgi:hypothetical protein
VAPHSHYPDAPPHLYTATEATHEIDNPLIEWNLRISTYFLNRSTLKLALRRKEELNRTDSISDIIVSP